MTDQADRFGELAMSLHDQLGLAATVARVLEFAVETFHHDGASVMLLHRRRLEVFAATDPMTTETDQLQLDLGDGPSLRAVTGGEVLVEDTMTDQRWPAWIPAAAANGARSLLALRLRTAHSVGGVLNLVSAKPHAFTDGRHQPAQLLALHASIAIASARRETHLDHAVRSRGAIGQAVGRLMERYEIDTDQAFAVLRRLSQDRNERLHLIARYVVATGRLPEPELPVR